MSKKELKPIQINKSNIKDIIAESKLIREFAMYGCDEAPGRIIGYNPISKKCVDITGYDGPDAPIEVPRVPSIGKKGGGSVLDVFTDPRKAAQFLFDIYINAFDPEQIKDCAMNNPTMSGLGFFIGATNSGKSVVTLLPRIALTSVAPKGIRSSIIASRELANYKVKHRGLGRRVLDTSLDTLKKTRGTVGLLAAGAIAAVGVGLGVGKAFFDFQQKKDVMSFLEWAESEAWGDQSYDNWKCLGAAAVLSVAIGALGRAGTDGLVKIAGKALTAPATVPVKIIKAITRSNSMKNFFKKVLNVSLKGVSTKNLSTFKELEKANLLPSGSKIILDTSDGAGILKLEGFSGQVKIPADKVPDSLKKSAGGGDLILDSKELSQELSEISGKVSKGINEQLQGGASAFRDSPYQRQLKLFKQVLAKGDNLTEKAINSQAFENSVSLLNKMHDDAEKMVSNLSKLEKSLLKQRSSVKSLVSNLSKGTELPDMRKVELEVLKAKPGEVDKVLAELYPGASGIESFQKVSEYFKNYKDFDLTQKELITQLELGKKVLLDETGVVKSLVSDKKGANALEDWLSSEAGQKWANSWNSFPGRRREVLKAVSSQPLKNALSKFLASDDLMIIGAAGVATAIAGSKEAKIDNSEELQEIVSIMDDQVGKLSFENYLSEDGNRFDAQKMLLALLSTVEQNTSKYTPQTQEALKAWKNDTTNNKVYISKINKYVNRSDQGLPNETDLKNRLKQIVRGTITPDKVNESKEVLIMNKKDIKQLVAEFLNENTGMGYGKYPYHASEHSEAEPDQDYMIEWSALIDDACGPRKKNIDGDPKTVEDAAVEIAKILVKDSDLFRDVLEMCGSNKSVGTEILRQIKAVKEKKTLDSELKV